LPLALSAAIGLPFQVAAAVRLATSHEVAVDCRSRKSNNFSTALARQAEKNFGDEPGANRWPFSDDLWRTLDVSWRFDDLHERQV
jgi:hypothetical protein